MPCEDACVAPVATPPLRPRAEWDDHPHFPGQTLLLGSHENFRRISAMLRDTAAARAGEPDWRFWAGSLFARWQGAMGGHEHYEEHKLYPYLERRFSIDAGGLRQDHEALHRLADEVASALLDGDDAAVRDGFVAYDAALLAHLEAEEALVIPLLLEMSPDEFAQYTTTSVHRLLRDLDTCDDAPDASLTNPG